MMDVKLTPDLNMARRHLCLLDETAEAFVFQTFDDSGRKDSSLARVLYGTLDQHARELAALQERGAGVFVTVNLSNNGGRKREDIVACRAIWREADKTNMPELPIEPHFIIETSPGKHHEYLVIEHTDDLCTCDGIMERMVRDYGSDPNAKDRARVLRLAGFYHLKNSAQPHLVKILHEGGGLPYTIEKIAAAIPPLQKSIKAASPISGIISEGSRNGTLTSFAGSMRQRGASEDAILAAITVMNTERCVPPLAESELRAIAKSISKYEPTGVPNTDAKTTDRRFKLVRAGDIEATPPRWVVRDVLEEYALALVFGDPGCGKSFWALDLALCITTGTPHHGHTVQQGPVIYIAGEGQNGIKRRLIAWSIARGIKHNDALLLISLIPTALTDKDAMKAVLAAIDEATIIVGTPRAVIIDTLARNFGPGDESSTPDMGKAISAADTIRARYHTTILLVHHSGHADKTRARGAMALKAALDAEYRMDKDEAGIIRLEATKMKEAEHPAPMAFRLRPVDLDLIDHDTGKVVTSAALELTSYEPRAVKGKQGRGKWQSCAYEILMSLWSDRQDREGEATRIPLNDWKKALRNAGIPRQRIPEITKSLIDVQTIQVSHGFITPVI